jgi:hypothetical protein
MSEPTRPGPRQPDIGVPGARAGAWHGGGFEPDELSEHERRKLSGW